MSRAPVTGDSAVSTNDCLCHILEYPVKDLANMSPQFIRDLKGILEGYLQEEESSSLQIRSLDKPPLFIITIL
jgi:hypothetical protein